MEMKAPAMAEGRDPTWALKKSYPAFPGELASAAKLNPNIKNDMITIMIDVLFITTPDYLFALNPDQILITKKWNFPFSRCH
jgi:hypothetical protein